MDEKSDRRERKGKRDCLRIIPGSETNDCLRQLQSCKLPIATGSVFTKVDPALRSFYPYKNQIASHVAGSPTSVYLKRPELRTGLGSQVTL